jgi:hypothetical protein
MKGVLLRVGCDITPNAGHWNAPVDLRTREYVYVPIPENRGVRWHLGKCPTYGSIYPALRRLGVKPPSQLAPDRKVHLDPDFTSLTIGEPYHENGGKLSSRGQPLDQLDMGDFVVFFAGFRAIDRAKTDRLAYCLLGVLHIQSKLRVGDLPAKKRRACAHGRRKDADNDLALWGNAESSGRFPKALLIGEYRDRSYRVTKELLAEWGDLAVEGGYIQRSARPPFFLDPGRFLNWLNGQEGIWPLLHSNW